MTLKLKNKKNGIVELTSRKQKLIGSVVRYKDKQIRIINKLDGVRLNIDSDKFVFRYTGVILD